MSGQLITTDNADFSLATARAIHCNLIKIPEYLVSQGANADETTFREYIRGRFAVGLIDASGNVAVSGLHHGNRLIYSKALGLVIERSS